MYERSTNSNQPEKAQAIHSTSEASDPQRMGIDRQRCGGRLKASDSPENGSDTMKNLELTACLTKQKASPKPE